MSKLKDSGLYIGRNKIGFDKKEVEYLNVNGFISVSLGKRILRSETAPLYLLSVIGFMDERGK